MSKITIFPSVRETSSGHFITIETALQRIKNNPKQHDLIQRIRNSTDKAQRDELNTAKVELIKFIIKLEQYRP